MKNCIDSLSSYCFIRFKDELILEQLLIVSNEFQIGFWLINPWHNTKICHTNFYKYIHVNIQLMFNLCSNT